MRSVRSTYDHVVLGGGLAGFAIASELISRGRSVCLIEKNTIASGASGTPLGLVNPATGRFATKVWKAEECYSAILADLTRVQKETDKTIFVRSGVMRPAQTPKIARRMLENIKTTKWPEDWIEWRTASGIASEYKGVHVTDGGVWLPEALTVDISTYLKEKSRFLTNKGVKIIENCDAAVQPLGEKWSVTLDQNTHIESSGVIYATGSSSTESLYWKDIPLHPVKGQVATFKTSSGYPYPSSISALGYLGSLDSESFTIGSTYEHKFDHDNPDDEGLKYLKDRMSKVIPDLIKDSVVTDRWAGIRASSPNRKPILGKHPQHKGLFMFSGLASKGLLYSAYLGKILADHILKGTDVPSEISLERYQDLIA